MTVKELKKLLEDVDDELELVGYQNGMEQSGLLPISKYDMKTLQGERVTNCKQNFSQNPPKFN